MKILNIKRTSALASVAVVAVLGAASLVASPLVYARNGVDDTTTSTTSSTSGSPSGSTTETHRVETSPTTSTPTPAPTSTSGSGRSSTDTDTDTETNDDATRTEHGVEVETNSKADDSTAVRVNSLQAKAKQLLEARRSDGGSLHSVADRQKACALRQTAIDAKIARYNSSASESLTSYDAIFARVQAYQATNQLPVANFSTLVANTATAKTAATGAVAALSTVSVKIDCSASDPAAAITTVKTAVMTAKSALKEYRTALKSIITTLLAAKSTAADTTGGTN